MTKTNEIALKNEQIDLSNPSDIMAFATNLKDLIVQNKLFTNVKGKNYVNVEGWQIAGAFTGMTPMLEKLENLSQGNSYKYQAEVSLRDKDDRIVGRGIAICTNKEVGKTNFDEYAVASMAQTRAVGKAYRMKIGWLLKVAGYETTPAEEMSQVVEAEVIPKKTTQKVEKKPPYTMRDVSIAKTQLANSKTMDELKARFGTLGPEKADPEVIAVKDEMKDKLLNSQEVEDDGKQ